MTSIILMHNECEHSGDIDRDHKDLRKVGLSFRRIWECAANGPEIGVSVIETNSSLEEVNKFLSMAEDSCIHYARLGNIDEARDLLEEHESEYSSEYGDEEDF